jgi:hypothetical protein
MNKKLSALILYMLGKQWMNECLVTTRQKNWTKFPRQLRIYLKEGDVLTSRSARVNNLFIVWQFSWLLFVLYSDALVVGHYSAFYLNWWRIRNRRSPVPLVSKKLQTIESSHIYFYEIHFVISWILMDCGVNMMFKSRSSGQLGACKKCKQNTFQSLPIMPRSLEKGRVWIITWLWRTLKVAKCADL